MKSIKKLLQYALAASLSIFLLASCDLDLFPTTAIAYKEGGQLFVSSDDVKSFENGILSSYRGLYYGSLSQTEEVMMDGFNATASFGNNYGGPHRCDFEATNYEAEDTWEYNYGAIKNYNIVISNADNVDKSLKESARIMKGEAFFFRASSYLSLARHYGKSYSSSASTDLAVPLVTVYDQKAKPARATVKEVYDQIKSDLDSAAVILANVAGAVRAQKPTIDAVNALYARYYLDIADYGSAASYAEKVISSAAGYALASDQAAMDKEYVNDNGTEPIMQMYASLTEGGASNPIFTQMGTNNEVPLYFAPYYVPSKKLVDAYEEGDLRFTTWFSKKYPVFVNGTYHEDKFYVFTKYYDNPGLRAGKVPTGNHARKTLLISEMYLIAAEAYSQSGNAGSAKTALNTLQGKRGASPTDGTLAFIKNEWFKETVGEGLRLSCIKRWGDSLEARTAQAGAIEANALMTGPLYDQRALSSSDPHLLWPVPTYELQVNRNLIQNPGYSDSE